ncbi:hypothetical protein [Maridesulfovibrio ferrireducens]|uniref:hypothetical protein n=1 Tax=Maridesulfovibrio ferrireducens TaxID=246191 RepID=UPI001A319BA3|nr:hypothetical protein [Maridesulfovibrio ferrireducens]MBI9112717.1 hypothetical protein [Maridesulfovibrio ferrireducens]
MKKQTLSIFVLLLAAAVLMIPSSGFASEKKMKETILNLDYTPIEIESPPCSIKIAVVKFTESKPIKEIGQSKLFKYIPSIEVGTWMAKSLYSQLKSQGYNVEYFETMDDAGNSFIITGVANKVYIARPGQLEMKYKVQLDGMVTKDNKLLFSKNYISKQEKEFANTGQNAGKLMAGLHDSFSLFIPQAIKIINDNN